MKRSFFIATMGCQMNENDSDSLAQHLMNSGLTPIETYEDADLVMINTCAVREKAQQKAFSLLGRMIALKKRRPGMILGMMGCIAQQEGEALLKRYPELDLVLGTREIDRVPLIVDRIVTKGERVVATNLKAENSHAPVIREDYFRGRLKGYITIMEGCNNFCSYCIVPYVRGREKSQSPDGIMAQAKNLVSQGTREITLLGQNVNSYNYQDQGGVNFPELIMMLGRLEDLYRVRFTTSHPKDLSDQLIDCFRHVSNLCAHIHLPFQSGSNRVLKMMNRGYTRESYIELVHRLRKARPDIAITSDVIVGFPGETDDDFHETIDMMDKIEFDNLFSFMYSDRKGTKAEKMDNKISEDVKLSRLNMLQARQKSITLKKHKMLEGAEQEILVDGLSRRKDQYTGRTSSNKVVNFTSNIDIIGELVNVKIERSYMNSLQGVLIKS